MARVVSKLLPVVEMVTLVLAGAVHDHHTERPPRALRIDRFAVFLCRRRVGSGRPRRAACKHDACGKVVVLRTADDAEWKHLACGILTGRVRLHAQVDGWRAAGNQQTGRVNAVVCRDIGSGSVVEEWDRRAASEIRADRGSCDGQKIGDRDVNVARATRLERSIGGSVEFKRSVRAVKQRGMGIHHSSGGHAPAE